MKKLLILLLVCGVTLTGCKFFSKGNTELARNNAKLDSMLKTERVAHDKEIEQMKQESQAKIDSIQASCKSQLNRYYIIVGAFKVSGNADGYLKQMTGKGYPAQIVNHRDFQMVSVNAFSSLREALNQLGNFRNEVNKEAWIYVR